MKHFACAAIMVFCLGSGAAHAQTIMDCEFRKTDSASNSQDWSYSVKFVGNSVRLLISTDKDGTTSTKTFSQYMDYVSISTELWNGSIGDPAKAVTTLAHSLGNQIVEFVFITYDSNGGWASSYLDIKCPNAPSDVTP